MLRKCQILGAFKRSHLIKNIIRMNANFMNFPATRPISNFCIPQGIWYQNAPNWAKISKTVGIFALRPHVSGSRRLSLPHSQEFAWILLVNKPECVMFELESSTLIFRRLTRNRAWLVLYMLEFPFLVGISLYFASFLWTKPKCTKLNDFKEVWNVRRDADQISWPDVKRDFHMRKV